VQFNFLIENISSMQDWDESLKLKFLSLAAQFDPEKTISIIANDRFPLDQAMDICRRASNLQGIAFIQSPARLQGRALHHAAGRPDLLLRGLPQRDPDGLL